MTETKRYDVLKIEPGDDPIYLLVPAAYEDDEDEREANTSYLYEERQCPHDIIASCKHVIVGGDTDPHGIIDYVKTIEVTWNYPCDPDEVLRPLIPEAFGDSDGTATAAVCEDIPVPKDCQARAESIAQDQAHHPRDPDNG